MTLAGVPVRDALDSAVVAIAASGSDTPRLDAELLLAHALGDLPAAVLSVRRRPEGQYAVAAISASER